MTRFLQLILVPLLLLPIAALADGDGFADLTGKPHRVADFTGGGQWTVVMIWASDCSVCRGEAPELEAFHQRHKGADARVLGLSVDGRTGVADARAFIADTGLSFPNLVGSGEDAAALFYDETGNNLLGTPAFLIYNPEGQLRSYQTGRLNIQILERLIRPTPPLAVAEG